MAEIDVEKVVGGELSQEDIEKLDNELTPEQKQAVVDAATAKFKETLGSLNAIRKEKNRVETKAKELDEKAQITEDKITQFRSEQVEKAKQRFKTEYELSDEDYEKVEKTFNRLDSGAVDADLVYRDLIGAYAYVNSDSLLKSKREVASMERTAEEATANEAASSSSAPATAAPQAKFSKEAEDLAKRAGISVEAAQRQVEQGTNRRLM